MCPDSGCIITDLISWLITNNFASGLITGAISSLVATWLLKLRERYSLRKHWKTILGKYSVYSLQKERIVDGQVIEIIETDDPLIFNVTSTGGNGNWKSILKVEKNRPVGIDSFRYDNNNDLFGMHDYIFDFKKQEILSKGLNHGKGTNEKFSLRLTKIDDNHITPE